MESSYRRFFICKKNFAIFVYEIVFKKVAVFYALPVLQLVIIYQKVLNDTGDQDLCYFNFLCAHPLGDLTDFNHVYSNLGYVMLGLLFIINTARRDVLRRKAQARNDRLEKVIIKFSFIIIVSRYI